MIKKVPMEEASSEQIYEFLLVSGIDNIPESQKNDRGALIGYLETAQLAKGGVYVADESWNPKQPVSNTEIGEYDPENEHWVRIRFSPMNNAGKADSLVFASVNGEWVRLPRGKDIVVRERFWRVISECIETRTKQSPGTQLSEAVKIQTERYPHQFFGFCGLVKDGPPIGIPKTSAVITK